MTLLKKILLKKIVLENEINEDNEEKKCSFYAL